MTPRKIALVLGLALSQAWALAGEPVPPASRPDPAPIDLVQIFRDQQVVLTPPEPEAAKKRTVPARVIFSPWVERAPTAEEAYYAAHLAYEARRQERMSRSSGASVPPPPPPPPAPSYTPSWTWIPSFGIGLGSHGSLLHFGLSGFPPYWGWMPW